MQKHATNSHRTRNRADKYTFDSYTQNNKEDLKRNVT